MFTWICPKCGGEVLPSYDDCPRCNPPQPRSQTVSEAPAPQEPAATPAPQAPQYAPPPPGYAAQSQQQYPPPQQQYGSPQQQYAPPQQQYTPPQQQYTPPQQQYTPPQQQYTPPQQQYPPPPQQYSQPQQQYAPPQQQYVPPPPFAKTPFSDAEPAAAAPARRLSPMVVGILAAAGMAALLTVLYLFVLPDGRRSAKANVAPVAMEAPGTPGTASPASKHPLAKHLEVTGLRLTHAGKGKVDIRYTVVNHSAADLPELKMNVSIQSADKVFFEFPATVPPLGPFESRDLKVAVPTELKPYELPDWQMMRPHFVVQAE